MQIDVTVDIKDNTRIFTITVPRHYIAERCQEHPCASLITTEQGLGIIEDAILLSMGMELKPKEKNNV